MKVTMNWLKVIAAFLTLKIYLSIEAKNIITGIFDKSCTRISTECPNENVTFWLYTKKNRDNPIQLNPVALNVSDFKRKLPIKILIHGYTGHKDFSPNNYIRPVLLEKTRVYVISVDYEPIAKETCYYQAVNNIPGISQCIAQFINNLIDLKIVKNSDLHVIGFSLGAHVAGQLSNYVNSRLSHITGLDPAKPLFVTVSKTFKLDETDADFVDVLHTDVMGRGLLRSSGHVDFYANILNRYQPGCQNEEEAGSCSHDRAPQYYAESIENQKGFYAKACTSWFHYVINLCGFFKSGTAMGYTVNKNARGAHFFNTNHESPFALGNSGVLRSVGDFISTGFSKLKAIEIFKDYTDDYDE